MKTRSMISFDWAMKRLLRNKANFDVLEGFLSELLHRRIVIKHIAESEGTKEDKEDKYNKVDIIVEADNKELVLIELQYISQDDYYHRILYGVSKSITEHIHEKEEYSAIRKLYSISIVYFDLGTGDDYVYYGNTNFRGLHTNTELQLKRKHSILYGKKFVGEIFPDYYIIKVNKFKKVNNYSEEPVIEEPLSRLDEWIYYFKTNKIRDEFTAQGIDKAREVLVYDNLTDDEKRAYKHNVEAKRIKRSEFKTAFTDGEIKGEAKGKKIGKKIGEKKGLAKGRAERDALKEQMVVNASEMGMSIDTIIKLTGLTTDETEAILKKHNKRKQPRQK